MTNENPLRIEYSPRFKKQLKEVSQEIKSAFLEARELFDEDPNDPALRNHKLKGKFASFRSIDVTGDYRRYLKLWMARMKWWLPFTFLEPTHSFMAKIEIRHKLSDNT